jgi:hypothetical protein
VIVLKLALRHTRAVLLDAARGHIRAIPHIDVVECNRLARGVGVRRRTRIVTVCPALRLPNLKFITRCRGCRYRPGPR